MLVPEFEIVTLGEISAPQKVPETHCGAEIPASTKTGLALEGS